VTEHISSRTLLKLKSLCTRQVLFGVNQRLRIEDVDSPLIQIRPVKTCLVAVVTGDRGLCGGYNNFVIKKACAWPVAAVPPCSGSFPPCSAAAASQRMRHQSAAVGGPFHAPHAD